MSVSELLRSQSRWGRTRTRKFLVPLAVNENRQLGRLTLRQREALAGALEEKQAHVAEYDRRSSRRPGEAAAAPGRRRRPRAAA